jgi:hypothetical protein
VDAVRIIWDLEEDPDGNVQHVAEHVDDDPLTMYPVTAYEAPERG